MIMKATSRSQADGREVSSKADTRGICLPCLDMLKVVPTKLWTICKRLSPTGRNDFSLRSVSSKLRHYCYKFEGAKSSIL